MLHINAHLHACNHNTWSSITIYGHRVRRGTFGELAYNELVSAIKNQPCQLAQ